MFGVGFALFLILLLLRKLWAPSKKIMMPLYFIGYGIIRFFIEFFREPDAHIGLNALGLSRGQMLCVAMVIIGLAIIPFFLKNTKTINIAKVKNTSDKKRKEGGDSRYEI
jgi:phosphatidylglycerol:prolipoprotein diacylglycerol transferase